MTFSRPRRRQWIAALAMLLGGATGVATHADTYPDKPITLYVGFAAGGAADTIARTLAEEMSRQLGQRVIVDNRAGASGNIATQVMLGKEADGYSLLFAAIHLATNPALAGVKYNPATDLAMVSQITSVPVVMLASNASGLKSPKDVDAAARKAQGGLKVGSGGVGTSSHLAMELYHRALNVPMIHVPYKGGAPANVDLMGGELDMMFDLMSGSLRSTIEAGKIRPLAVMQRERIPSLPQVPSAAELGLPESTYIRSWQGIAVRAGTPAQVVARLRNAVAAAAASEAFRARASQLGSEVVVSESAKAFQDYYAAELRRWDGLIRSANIKAE